VLALRSEERGLDGLVDRAVLVMLAVHDDERSRSNEAGIPLVAEVAVMNTSDRVGRRLGPSERASE